MTTRVRLFLIVPPILLISLFANAQIEGKIDLLPDEITYQVSIIPTVDWSPPQSITNSAQITLRAGTGTLDPINFQNVTGNWTMSGKIISPPDASNYDYFSFTLNAPLTSVNYQNGVELPLFSFENDNPCVPVRLVSNDDDPFLPPNSLSVNIGNQFTVLAGGLGVNAYSGNAQESANCPPPNPLFMSALAVDSMVDCPGDVTQITVTAIGGTEPYDVSWANVNTNDFGAGGIDDFEGSISFGNLPAGTYSVSIVDVNNLLSETTVVIEEPLPIDFDLDADNASCDGSGDGQITIRNLNGGTISGDYQYDWSINVNQTDSIVSNLNSGTYAVTITDDNGCSGTASAEIENQLILEPNPDVAHVSCYGESDGVINLYSVGSNQPFLFNWGGNGYSGDESSAWGLTAGMYYYTITDDTGVCNLQDSIEVMQPEALQMDFILKLPTCEQPNVAEITIENVLGAVNGYQFSQDGEFYFDDNQFLLVPGDFNSVFVKDGTGCEMVEEVEVPLYHVPQIFMEKAQTINIGDELRLKPIIFPEENLSLKWSPAETLSCDDCPSPMAQPVVSTAYTLTATDSLGCQAESSTTISVKKIRRVYIPNAFSPNGDGDNDYFNIYSGGGIRAVRSFQIFNRWGALVYESEADYSSAFDSMGWNGTFNGQKMKEGVYIYSAMIEFSDGEVENYAGEVTLLR